MANNTLNMIAFGRRPRFQMARRYAKLYQKRLCRSSSRVRAIGKERGHTRQGCRRHHRGAWHRIHPNPPGAAARPRRNHRTGRLGGRCAVNILANNLPVAKGTVVVDGNRIAVNVAELLPRPPDMRTARPRA